MRASQEMDQLGSTSFLLNVHIEWKTNKHIYILSLLRHAVYLETTVKKNNAITFFRIFCNK